MKRPKEKPPKTRLLVVEKECLEDLRWWVDMNRKTALRIFDLIEAIMRDPFDGIGKPVPLLPLVGALVHRAVYDAGIPREVRGDTTGDEAVVARVNRRRAGLQRVVPTGRVGEERIRAAHAGAGRKTDRAAAAHGGVAHVHVRWDGAVDEDVVAVTP